MSRLLTKCGLTVPHEQLGKHGSVSSFLAVDDYWYPLTHEVRRSDVDFDVAFHQIRHPLRVISSLASYDRKIWWHWQEKHTGISMDMDPVERAALFWIRWTDLCDKQTWTMVYRIEELPRIWTEFSRHVGIDCDMPDLGTTVGQRKHRELGWEALGVLRGPVERKAVQYGYDA